jgi:hypothetical protein
MFNSLVNKADIHLSPLLLLLTFCYLSRASRPTRSFLMVFSNCGSFIPAKYTQVNGPRVSPCLIPFILCVAVVSSFSSSVLFVALAAAQCFPPRLLQLLLQESRPVEELLCFRLLSLSNFCFTSDPKNSLSVIPTRSFIAKSPSS